MNDPIVLPLFNFNFVISPGFQSRNKVSLMVKTTV